MPELRTAPPPEFDGPGDAWSPEHLLLASVETCFLFTLRAVAQASRIEFEACDVTVEGTVDRSDGVTRFTEIVPAAAAQARARKRIRIGLGALWKRRSAPVSSRLRSPTPIRLEAELS